MNGERQSAGTSSTSSTSVSIVYARAKHAFEGRNNDELSFRKNEIITVTQQLEGGWWEGTLNSNTGWFPSDYVVVIPESERLLRIRDCISPKLNGESVPYSPPVVTPGRQTYRQEVTKNFIDAESKYVKSMSDLYTNVLLKLKATKCLSDPEFATLCGNLKVVMAHQTDVLEKINQTVLNDVRSARIGGILLQSAPILKQLLRIYCENHPKSVDLILQKRSEIEKALESFGGHLKDVISGLSKPFRHLETYASALSELERSMPEAHVDRGDTRRAASVYTDISNFCNIVRKQKEMQLEFLSNGKVEGLDEPELTRFGEIIRMGILAIENDDEKVEEPAASDRCLVLFPSTLFVLQLQDAVNSYILKKKIELDGKILRKSEGKVTKFKICQEGEVQVSMEASSSEETQRWIESFTLCPGLIIDDSCNTISPIIPQKIELSDFQNMAELSPLRRPEVSRLPTSIKADNAKNLPLPPGIRMDHSLEMILPEGCDERDGIQSKKRTKLYSGYALRPYPVMRNNCAVDYGKKAAIKLRREATITDQEDAFLLRLIEGYCTSAGSSRTENLPPQLIVADDEKLFVEEIVGDEVVVREKSLVDTVYALKDQIIEMQKEIQKMNKTIDKEQKARRRLEEMVRRRVRSPSVSVAH